MSKQTAVEWLVNEYAKAFKISINAVMGESIEQAKAMEMEQIIDAYKYGNQSDVYFKPEQYYNETYGGDK